MHPPQEKTGLRAKPTDKGLRNTDIEDAKTKLLQEAYDFQNVLSQFKKEKRKLQAKIQCEIDAVNLKTYDKSPKKLCPTINSLRSSLVALNTELTAAKSIIAESCKNSIYPFNKVKELEDMVFYKRINIKWVSAELELQLTLRKQIAYALSLLKNPESADLPDQFSFPTYKNGTAAPKQTASLISELKAMITEFSTLVVKSKFSNIQLENSKQTTTDPPDKPVPPFAFKPTKADNDNVSTLAKPPQDTPPTFNFKFPAGSGLPVEKLPIFEFKSTTTNGPRNPLATPAGSGLPIEKLPIFEFKSITTDGRRSPLATPPQDAPPTIDFKLPAGSELPVETFPIFEVKSTTTNGRRNRRAVRLKKEVKSDTSSNIIDFKGDFDTGTEIVPFRPLVGGDVFKKSAGNYINITVHHQCITLMEEYNTKSLEELRLTDYVRAACRGRKYSPVFALPDDQLRKILFFYSKSQFRSIRSGSYGLCYGTKNVKFEPTVVYEEFIESDVEKKDGGRIVCITLMPNFRKKSLEELRMEDYRIGRRCSNAVQRLEHGDTFFGVIDLDSPWQKVVEACRPAFGRAVFEDRQIEDYKMGEVHVKRTGQAWKSPKLGGFATTDASVRYKPSYFGEEDETDVFATYHCITVMPQYEKQSFEELRLLDYMKAAAEGKKYAPVFALPQNHIMNNAFFLIKSLTEVLRLHHVLKLYAPRVGTESGVNVKYRCINFMPEFENKSLEEIRLDNYVTDLYYKMVNKKKEDIRKKETRETPIPMDQTPERDSTTTKTRETPSQKYQTPERDSTTKTRETPTKKYYGFGQDPSPQTPETPSYKGQTPERDSTTKTRETPTKIYYGFGQDPSSQTPETPSQKDQTPVRDSAAKARETPSQKDQTPVRDTAAKARETPSQKDQTPVRDTAAKARETPSQKDQTPVRNTAAKARETPSQKDQTPVRDTAAKARESPRKVYGFGEYPPPQVPETSSQKDQTPVRDSTITTKETPTQKTQTPETPINEKYEKAIKIANEALKLNPDSPNDLAYRANAFLMLRNYKQALEDAEKAIAIDYTTIKGYILEAKCCIKLGDIARGESAVNRGSTVLKELREKKPMREQNESNYASDHTKIVELATRLKELRSNQEKARKLMEREKYYDALDLINACLDDYCPSCYKTKLLKAECLANVGKYQEAQDIAINLSLFERYDADAIFVVGLCLYNQDKYEQAVKKFRTVNSLDPDNKKAAKMYKIAKTKHTKMLLQQKKEEGNQAFKNGNFENALKLYAEALLIDEDNKFENSKLYYNRATVLAKLNRTWEAEQECTIALHLKQDYIKALERRAQCCSELDEYEDAVEDYKRLVELYNKQNLADHKVKDLLCKAEKALTKFKRTNYYYKILGVKNTIKSEDIKKAYYTRSRLYHPDKFQEKCVADRGANRFKRVKEAYDFLSDKEKRRNYDRRQGDDDDDSDD